MRECDVRMELVGSVVWVDEMKSIEANKAGLAFWRGPILTLKPTFSLRGNVYVNLSL